MHSFSHSIVDALATWWRKLNSRQEPVIFAPKWHVLADDAAPTSATVPQPETQPASEPAHALKLKPHMVRAVLEALDKYPALAPYKSLIKNGDAEGFFAKLKEDYTLNPSAYTEVRDEVLKVLAETKK